MTIGYREKERERERVTAVEGVNGARAPMGREMGNGLNMGIFFIIYHPRKNIWLLRFGIRSSRIR